MKLTLKQWRRLRDMTQEQLADAVKVSTGAISKWESGKSSPTVKVLQSIADVLEIGIEDILMP